MTLKCTNTTRGGTMFRLCVYEKSEGYSEQGDFSVQAYDLKQNGRMVGELHASAGNMNRIDVVKSKVDVTHMQLRIGTQLYQLAAEEACRQGRLLASDIVRSRYSESFWRKQARKGRAKCLTKGREGGGFWHPWDLPDSPRLNRLQPKKRGATEFWPCMKWGLKPTTCGGEVDLSGLRRRRR